MVLNCSQAKPGRQMHFFSSSVNPSTLGNDAQILRQKPQRRQHFLSETSDRQYLAGGYPSLAKDVNRIKTTRDDLSIIGRDS